MFKEDWQYMGSAIATNMGFLEEPPYNYSPSIWIGLIKEVGAKKFKWSDRTAYDYFKWGRLHNGI